MIKCYSRKQLDNLGENILKDYDASHLLEARPVDVYRFAENYMGLTVDFKNLSPDKSILGLTSFNSGIFPVWDDQRDAPYMIEVAAGTVIIDNDLLRDNQRGRENFTVIHECSHQKLHKSLYLKNDGKLMIACSRRDIGEGGSKRKLVTEHDWEEWQSNSLTASILMPSKVILRMFRDFMGISTSEKLPIPLNFIIDYKVMELAELFNVSHMAMKIRLEHLGLLEIRAYDIDEEIKAYE